MICFAIEGDIGHIWHTQNFLITFSSSSTQHTTSKHIYIDVRVLGTPTSKPINKSYCENLKGNLPESSDKFNNELQLKIVIVK